MEENIKNFLIMKNKLLLPVIFMMASLGIAFGQKNSDTYIITTSSPMSEGRQTGVVKEIVYAFKSGTPVNNMTTFHITSLEKDYNIHVDHYNFEGSRVYKIVEMERSKLKRLNAIDADEFIRTHDKEQAEAWRKEHIGKTIWIIDRNDFYTSPTTGKEMMKLIETTIYPTEPHPTLPHFETIIINT
jgi:hypothetical protein